MMADGRVSVLLEQSLTGDILSHYKYKESEILSIGLGVIAALSLKVC